MKKKKGKIVHDGEWNSKENQFWKTCMALLMWNSYEQQLSITVICIYYMYESSWTNLHIF